MAPFNEDTKSEIRNDRMYLQLKGEMEKVRNMKEGITELIKNKLRDYEKIVDKIERLQSLEYLFEINGLETKFYEIIETDDNGIEVLVLRQIYSISDRSLTGEGINANFLEEQGRIAPLDPSYETNMALLNGVTAYPFLVSYEGINIYYFSVEIPATLGDSTYQGIFDYKEIEDRRKEV